jgi:hypothetical protein
MRNFGLRNSDFGFGERAEDGRFPKSEVRIPKSEIE